MTGRGAPAVPDADVAGSEAWERALRARAAGSDDGNDARDAMGELLRYYQPNLLRLVRRLIPREAEALELVQEAFLRAFQSRHRYDQRRPFRPWLFAIAINLSRNHLRAGARKEQPTDLRPQARGMWTAAVQDGEASAQRLEQVQMLDGLLQRLSPDERTLLLLRHCEGMSYRELAVAMGRPAAVLKMRAHRALGRLRAFAAEHSTATGETTP